MPLTLRPTGLGGYARANPQQPATLMAPPIKIMGMLTPSAQLGACTISSPSTTTLTAACPPSALIGQNGRIE